MYENTVEDIIKAQNGDQQVMEKLIQENKGLVWSIVKRFTDRGYEIEDLCQIGMMGFIKSIKKFDTSFEVKLSTYAVPYILGEIKRYLRDDGPVKVSRGIKELAVKIKELQREEMRKSGRELKLEEIAKKLKVSKEEVAAAISSSLPVESIDESAYGEEGKISKIEQITNEVDEATCVVDKLLLKQLIEGLQERERQIIVLRYFRGKTQQQVAKIIGVTQVQVSRIEKKILQEMKRKLLVS